jgi:hypothetical protein
MKHVIKEGSIYHVPFWDSNGIHCSEKDCELNDFKKVRISTNLGYKEFIGVSNNAFSFLLYW